ncbi:MAG: hypothetical protein HY907_00020 [Deltaproteobacteria bacterium]|nr:hypothetical protein [Deltaproteobacteria bacterium]
MRKCSGTRIVLVVAGLAAAAACKLSTDQQAAVDACRGNAASPSCEMANRMLASGSPGIAKALGQEMQARATAEQQAAAAKAHEAELAAQGIDPCQALQQKLAADHPAAACAPKIQDAVNWLKDDPGCAAALDDPEGTAMTAADLLGDCDSAAP